MNIAMGLEDVPRAENTAAAKKAATKTADKALHDFKVASGGGPDGAFNKLLSKNPKFKAAYKAMSSEDKKAAKAKQSKRKTATSKA